MRVKLVTLMSGPDGTHAPGTELEMPDRQARELIAGNYATEVKRRRPETSALLVPEAAVTAEQTAAEHLGRIAAATGRGRGKRARVVAEHVPGESGIAQTEPSAES